MATTSISQYFFCFPFRSRRYIYLMILASALLLILTSVFWVLHNRSVSATFNIVGTWKGTTIFTDNQSMPPEKLQLEFGSEGDVTITFQETSLPVAYGRWFTKDGLIVYKFLEQVSSTPLTIASVTHVVSFQDANHFVSTGEGSGYIPNVPHPGLTLVITNQTQTIASRS